MQVYADYALFLGEKMVGIVEAKKKHKNVSSVLDEDDIWYRNQDDFRSKYRAVIDYFDAVKIALTATPALHTTEIFGKPVYT